MNIKFLILLVLGSLITPYPSLSQEHISTTYQSNGSEVSGDLAQSTQNNGTISATTTTGFNIGKKIAITIKDPNGSFTNNPLFHPPVGFDPSTLGLSSLFAAQPDMSPLPSPWNNLSKSFLAIHGAIYANTDVSITINPSPEFIHEEDPSSRITPRYHYRLSGTHVNVFDDNSSLTSQFPITFNLSGENFSANGGVLGFFLSSYFYVDTISNSDRSGTYSAAVTFTVTAI